MGVDARADDPDYRPSLTVRVTCCFYIVAGAGGGPYSHDLLDRSWLD